MLPCFAGASRLGQISLLEGSAAILAHDGRNLSHDLHTSQTHAHYCDCKSSSLSFSLSLTYLLPRFLTASTLCTTCLLPLFTQPQDTFTQARSSAAPAALFLCTHAFHLPCLLPPSASLPAPPPLSTPTAGGALPALAVSATQAHARASRGEAGLVGVYGPARRARDAARGFERKLGYESRLKVLLRAGCPVCRRDARGRIA